jgi:SAM-dependent methyltransferase
MPTDSTQRFSNRVAYYVRSRPGYPETLIDFFRSSLSLNPAHVIADVGSGTGILSKLFLQNGNRVIGIEPNGPMREAGEKFLGAYPRFRSINGTAEATTLGECSVDFVIAGQAFHWFDAEKASAEFRRVLRAGGWCAMIWNERRSENSGFNAAYDRFIDQFTGDRRTAQTRGGSIGAEPSLRKFFGQTSFEMHALENYQILDWQGLLDRVYSSSYMPLPDDPTNVPMTAALREIFDAFSSNGQIRIEYETRVYFGQL